MFQPPAEHGPQGPILGHRNGWWTPAHSLKGQWSLAPLGSVLFQHSQPLCWVLCPLQKEIPVPHSSCHKDVFEKWNADTKTKWPYHISCLPLQLLHLPITRLVFPLHLKHQKKPLLSPRKGQLMALARLGVGSTGTQWKQTHGSVRWQCTSWSNKDVMLDSCSGLSEHSKWMVFPTSKVVPEEQQ